MSSKLSRGIRALPHESRIAPALRHADFAARFHLPELLAFERMTVLTAHFDGKVLIPDEPVNLPTDCALKVQVEPVPGTPATEKPLLRLVELAKRFPVTDGPSDGAAQHDHYLFGLPKRS